jgi:hypothetical protein
VQRVVRIIEEDRKGRVKRFRREQLLDHSVGKRCNSGANRMPENIEGGYIHQLSN